MQGTWKAGQTLVDIQAPLGIEYLGGPSANKEIAERSLQESQKQIGKTVELTVRFTTTPIGVIEDRVYNTRSRLDAFAGRPVVASVEYDGGSLTSQPSTTTRFKGPAAQKTLLMGHAAELVTDNEWVGSEYTRSIFALTNTKTSPPIFTDNEVIYKLERVDNEHVRGRIRIVGYLNAQSDKLYFEARQRSVSIQDYELVLEKIRDDLVQE
jgi:hypothetical protein